MANELIHRAASRGTFEPLITPAQLSALVHTPDDAIIGSTLDGTITSWNAAAEQLYGYAADEAIGRSIRIITPPEVWPKLDDLLTGIAGKHVPAHDVQHVTKDGRRIDVSVTISPVRGRRGEVIGASAVAHDIAARRQAEREVTALLTIAEHLNAAADPEQVLQEVVAVGVELLHARAASVVTNEGDHALRRYYWEAGEWQNLVYPIPLEGTITGWVVRNASAFRSDDLSREPLHYTAATPSDPFKTVLSVPVLSRSRKVVGVVHLFDRDGGRPFGDSDLRIARGLAHYAAVAWERADIVSRLVQLDEEQRKGERLRLAGELTAGLAHDLNNVLSVAIGRLDVLAELQRQQPSLPDSVNESLAVVRTALFDATQTVRRLQSFARGHTAHFADLHLDEVVRDAIELARPRWQREALIRGSTIRIREDYRAPGFIHGDAAELREAVLNLILNAVDALPNGGTISISIDESADGVGLSVADTGAGMTPEVLARAWEPFFTTKGDLGSGLGLPMVRGIAERHNAQAAIVSQPGRGTTVTLCFPHPAAPSTPPSALLPSASTPALRVLVVDDELRVRETTATMLRLLHHLVAEAESAEEALRLLAVAPFDLVITDHGMPGMTGLELAQRIHCQRPTLPVVLLTGWGEAFPAETIRGSGARLASKPLALDDLRSLLAWAAGARPAS